ncbi:xanthine dehydrogenase small subunit [Roseateles amylovorans]|uniref:Xanthine dehydrogenase small subunit n=1 Tax=Roseateles amylovorans TaxID=2978473 RepID=A0ABY6AX69_9BURK|nr:xanthine dehydrogenase small subunit [Roseateles amylovorans]UXH77513.1 xanthine dehydrogenase small subunit [Roseateles amylovorans]
MTVSRPIRFVHQGRLQSVTDLAPTTTVLQYLREQAHCAGTKEGCAEGDCGACTVVVASLDQGGQGLSLRNVNACIQFLPMLDGQALLTVEDLGSSTALHPVQQALVDCHGSQCGFCTPGFAMTMQALYERHQADGTRPTRQQLADDLAGNLCRCTGYRPLLDAGERMFDAPPQTLDRAPLIAALRTLREDPPLHYEAHARDGATQHVFAPHSLEAFAELRERLPQARLVAGATDVGLWVNKQHRELGDVILTARVEALRQIEATPTALRIGAAVPLEEAWRALTAREPALRELWLRFASPPVRHAGTLGGNLANGSPIGDGAPAMIALDAQLVLRRGTQSRRLPLEAFYLDYMKNALQPGEFVEAIEVPLRDPDAAPHASTVDSAGGSANAGGTTAVTTLRAYKISKRYDSDISAVCAVLKLTTTQGVVSDVRFVFGGMAGIVKRAAHAEAVVRGRRWDEATQAAAAAALSDDFQPLTDLRASADYRSRVAANLIRRFWLETREDDPLDTAATSVWQVIPPQRSVA